MNCKVSPQFARKPPAVADRTKRSINCGTGSRSQPSDVEADRYASDDVPDAAGSLCGWRWLSGAQIGRLFQSLFLNVLLASRRGGVVLGPDFWSQEEGEREKQPPVHKRPLVQVIDGI